MSKHKRKFALVAYKALNYVCGKLLGMMAENTGDANMNKHPTPMTRDEFCRFAHAEMPYYIVIFEKDDTIGDETIHRTLCYYINVNYWPYSVDWEIYNPKKTLEYELFDPVPFTTLTAAAKFFFDLVPDTKIMKGRE